jgi:acyl-CoA reductase-like NAD-dependent aldehyde dehydrogenase
MKTQELFIDGAWTGTSDHFEVTNPWDGAVIGRAAKCEREHVSAAVGAAAAAVRTPWPAHERAAVLRGAAALITERAEEFAQSIRAEAGKPITAARAEVGRAIDTIQFSAEAARGLTGRTVPLDAVKSGVGLLAFEELSPRGVVAAITPFNFPLNLVLHKVGPALAAGCPVVLKPSEKTPLVAGLLAQVLQEAGAASGFFNLVTGDPEMIVAGLLDDDRVAVVTFTGSAQLGWSLKARTPKKHHILELGSNTAMVVAGDADIARAVDAAVASSFTFAGQACISLQRVYVHERVAEEFAEKLVKAAQALPTGDPEDERVVVGPMITPHARDRVLAWVASAVGAGAKLRSGGELNDGVLLPTVLTDVPP